MSRSRAWADLGGGIVALTETELDDRTDEQVEHDATANADLAKVVPINRVRNKSKRTRTERTRPVSAHVRTAVVEPTDEGRAIIAQIRAQLRGPMGPAGPIGDHHAS